MDPLQGNEKQFYRRLETNSARVLLYEDHSLQQLALKQIPVEELSNKVSERKCSSSGIGKDELLIMELLKWFKYSFFTWVDCPVCDTCGNVTEYRGHTYSVLSELVWNADRVELYFCSFCKWEVRFPRYNHPKKLLETRRGRCGEWANCFTLLCRALCYEARLIVEWGDHLWTEVFLPSKNKWIHCDPCENRMNCPLMYESGWGKEISYVIAFSKDEVQDVTWRYSQYHTEVLKRRTLCNEAWLLSCCTLLTKKLQGQLNSQQKEKLLLRKIGELAEFFSSPDVKGDVLQGRTSGSLSWRLGRGECTLSSSKTGVVIQLSEHEIKARKLHLKYSCASDKYIRVIDSSETNQWDSLIFLQANIFRKVEYDWNTVYLARNEGSPSGFVTWKFSFRESELAIDSINLRLMCKVFENGTVKWILSSKNQEIYIPDGRQVTHTGFRGFREFSLTACLSGGHGPAAWQHAQLFRQSSNSTDFPFEIGVKLIERIA